MDSEAIVLEETDKATEIEYSTPPSRPPICNKIYFVDFLILGCLYFSFLGTVIFLFAIYPIFRIEDEGRIQTYCVIIGHKILLNQCVISSYPSHGVGACYNAYITLYAVKNFSTDIFISKFNDKWNAENYLHMTYPVGDTIQCYYKYNNYLDITFHLRNETVPLVLGIIFLVMTSISAVALLFNMNADKFKNCLKKRNYTQLSNDGIK